MKKLLYILLLCSAGVAVAQHSLKKAEELYAVYDYPNAVKAYEAYLENNQPSENTIAHVAYAYCALNEFEKAARWYRQLYSRQKQKLDEPLFYNYIHSLRALKKSDEADRLLVAWHEAKGERRSLQRMQMQQAHLDSLASQPLLYNISNLESNSRLADFGAAFYGNKIVYASGRDTIGTGGHIYKRNSQPYLKLYLADRHPEDGALFGTAEFIPASQSGYHNATACFSADGTVMYFSTNTVTKKDKLVNDGKGTNNLRIMKASLLGGKMVEVEGMPFNSTSYSVSHPALSPDGQWLYFASDMPGGFGGTDIYKVKIDANGTYNKPVNLGTVINTPGNEMFPFVMGDILYFASDRHYGFGGLDIFSTTFNGDLYAEPKNLGQPVNSSRDDFAYIIDSTGTYGYFSSNRPGGKGDDDLYAFRKLERPCSTTVRGRVVDSESGLAVEGAIITVYDAAGIIIANVYSDINGVYTVETLCGKQLFVKAIMDGYTTPLEPVEAGNNPPELRIVTFGKLITKANGEEKIKIEPIFFEFDKFNINPQAAAELDKVVYVLRNFPAVIIKIESHTDSRGDDNYNLRLSTGRAKATFDYIIAQGIDPARIESVTGYGETRLINNCGNGASCTEEEHLRNRRSEFIIVKK